MIVPKISNKHQSLKEILEEFISVLSILKSRPSLRVKLSLSFLKQIDLLHTVKPVLKRLGL